MAKKSLSPVTVIVMAWTPSQPARKEQTIVSDSARVLTVNANRDIADRHMAEMADKQDGADFSPYGTRTFCFTRGKMSLATACGLVSTALDAARAESMMNIA